jgi:hypothetical protein
VMIRWCSVNSAAALQTQHRVGLPLV